MANRSDSGIAIAIAAKTSTAAQSPNTRGDYSTGLKRCDDLATGSGRKPLIDNGILCHKVGAVRRAFSCSEGFATI